MERQIEKQEQPGELSLEEGLEEFQAEELYREWKQSGMKVQFETYQAIQIMEQMPEARWRTTLAVIDVLGNEA